MTASIFGATGFTGSSILQLLLQDSAFESVKIFVRKSIGLTHPKLKEYIIDFDKIENHQAEIQADAIFNCLGTTIQKAGSQAAQQRIDRDYPIAIAKVVKTGLMLNVSSVGADALAGNFYLKTKGEMENGVREILGDRAIFFRPSFIVGQRPEFRLGEKLGIYVMKPIDFFLKGNLSKWHSIDVSILAKSMVNAAKNKPSQSVLYYKDMIV